MADHNTLRGAGEYPHWKIDNLLRSLGSLVDADGAWTDPPEGIKRYTTSGVGSGYVGYYTRLASVSLAAQYQEIEQVIEVASGNTIGAHVRGCRIRWKVKQNIAMGGAPVVDLVVTDCHGLRPADFMAVTTKNDASETIVALYWLSSVTHEYLVFRPLVYFDDSTAAAYWYGSQGWIASLPSGTQAIGHDGKSHVSASRSTTLSIPTGVTPTVMVYATEAEDSFGEYNAGTGIFTAVEPGWYRVDATAALTNVTWPLGAYFRMRLVVEESPLEYSTRYAMANTAFTFTNEIHSEVWLEAGWTLWVEIEHNQGGAVNTFAFALLNTLSINRV